jgi:hypothetical protein
MACNATGHSETFFIGSEFGRAVPYRQTDEASNKNGQATGQDWRGN